MNALRSSPARFLDLASALRVVIFVCCEFSAPAFTANAAIAQAATYTKVFRWRITTAGSPLLFRSLPRPVGHRGQRCQTTGNENARPLRWCPDGSLHCIGDQHRDRRDGRSHAAAGAGSGRPLPQTLATRCRGILRDAIKPCVRRIDRRVAGRPVAPGAARCRVGVSMIAMALWTLKPDTLD